MDKNSKLCILCCDSFGREIADAVAAEAWDDVTIGCFPTRCGNPTISWNDLSPLVGEDNTQIVILGMACLRTLGDPPASWPPVRFIPLEQCFHLVAGSALISEAIERGAYLMTPAWLEHWPDRLADMGFRPENAGEFFRDVARELLLLDTGSDSKASTNLSEFAKAVELPAKRIAVGIDHTRLYLSKIVMEWRLEQSQHAARILEDRHARELSDQMMAIDCLSRLGRIMTEEQAISAIEELFRMLFAPQALHYLHVEDGKIDPDHAVPADLLAQMLALNADYAWTKSQQGFLLRIRRNGQPLGLVAIEHLAFPEYREHYLNLALSIADVCALAIENARAYQRTKAIEAELQEKEERLSLATLVNGVGIWDWNLETQEMIWDDSMYALYQIRREDFSGTEEAWRAALHPDDLAHGDREMKAALSGQKPFDTAFRVCWPTGEVHYIKAVAKVFRDDNGMPLRMLGTNIDITEQKRIEDALLKASLYARSLIEASLDPLVTISPEGKITDVNQATENATGRMREELIGSDFCDYFTEPVHARAGYRRVFSEGSVIDYPLSIRHVSGRITDVLYNASVYRNAQGQVEGVFAAARDITERKRVEAELNQYRHHLEELVKQRTLALSIAKDAAEAANRAKSIFLANMSHELRTPLNAILGFSGMMQKNAQLEQTERDNLSIINSSGEHLLSVINDVLEMAKIETGRIQLEEVSFDLCDMVHDVTNILSVRAKEKGLQLFIDPSSQFQRFVLADEGRLRQILINLLGNAIKFTLKGRVTLRLGTKQNAPAHLLIEVEDTGPGIPPEDQQRIFEPFVQLGEHGINQGSGLGLTISRQFVQMMGGTLMLESSLGKGSLFRVELPLKEAREADVILKSAEQAEGEVISLAPGQPDYRILVVEDQLGNQQLITRLLEAVGFQVKLAKNGEQSVQLFQSWQPHLIWMDRRMPVMDGIEATKAIRELPGGKEVKIVAVTASAFVEQRDEMLEVGIDDFVCKPYRFNEIYECLTRQLDVHFIYADTQTTVEVATGPLTTEMLSVLSPELKRELRNALESLEVERIRTFIAQVTLYDADLHKTMSLLAENFDYPTILKALQVESSDKES
jgi:PAS domain S-box-containing protein